jgi:hypothetical protein
VCGVEQFLVAEAAEGASFPVGADDPFAEHHLMQTLADCAGHVRTTSFGRVLRDPMAVPDRSQSGRQIIDLKSEL